MLECFFEYAGVLSRMRLGPLGGDIDDIAQQLVGVGYSRQTARRYLSLIGTFSRWAQVVGCTRPQEVVPPLVERFLVEVPTSPAMRSQARTALGHVLRHLARRYPRDHRSGPTSDPDAPLLAAFDVYLRDVRGLRRRSREGVLRVARRMLAWLRERWPGRAVKAVCAEDVLAFASRAAVACVSHSTRAGCFSHIRTFLRYLRWADLLHEDLACMVPRTPCWRMAHLPNHLEWTEVRRTIDAIDTADAVGKRDRALLLLLATTGLRNQELRLLQFRDICWRRGEVNVRRTKSGRGRVLPLLDEAGSALADYVLHGRPGIADATVFLRHRAPAGPLRSSSAVATIVRRRLASCGIRPRRAGAHLLRHSLATRMVQQNRPIKEVADLLGHRHIDTTAIYVKVALPQLSEVALPFPGDSP